MSTENHTMETASHHGEENHAHDHTKWYIATIAALFVLTAITVYAATLDFGSNFINLMVAMAIATVKATLVALFFMHLWWEKGLNAIVFLSSIFFVGVFMIFTFLDVNSRMLIQSSTPELEAAGIAPQEVPMYITAPSGGGEAANGAAAEEQPQAEESKPPAGEAGGEPVVR